MDDTVKDENQIMVQENNIKTEDDGGAEDQLDINLFESSQQSFSFVDDNFVVNQSETMSEMKEVQNVLFPPEELSVRETFVLAAIAFLKNRRTNLTSMQENYSFLKAKGLSDIEIRTACERIREQSFNVIGPSILTFAAIAKQRISELTLFGTFMRILKSNAVFSSSGFIIYTFYKKFLVPYFSNARPTVDDHLNALGEQVSVSLNEIKGNVVTFEEDLRQLKENINTTIGTPLETTSGDKLKCMREMIERRGAKSNMDNSISNSMKNKIEKTKFDRQNLSFVNFNNVFKQSETKSAKKNNINTEFVWHNVPIVDDNNVIKKSKIKFRKRNNIKTESAQQNLSIVDDNNVIKQSKTKSKKKNNIKTEYAQQSLPIVDDNNVVKQSETKSGKENNVKIEVAQQSLAIVDNNNVVKQSEMKSGKENNLKTESAQQSLSIVDDNNVVKQSKTKSEKENNIKSEDDGNVKNQVELNPQSSSESKSAQQSLPVVNDNNVFKQSETKFEKKNNIKTKDDGDAEENDNVVSS